METYDVDEFLAIQASVQISFELLGLSWHSDRIQKFLGQVSWRIGKTVQGRHDLPFAAYKRLAQLLEAERPKRGKNVGCFGAISTTGPVDVE